MFKKLQKDNKSTKPEEYRHKMICFDKNGITDNNLKTNKLDQALQLFIFSLLQSSNIQKVSKTLVYLCS